MSSIFVIILYMLYHSFVVHSMFINFHKIIRARVLHFVTTVITAIILLTLIIVKPKLKAAAN